MFQVFKLDEKGISIFELTIALPTLFLLVFGSIEIGTKINVLQMVSTAAQEGAILASNYHPAGVDVCPDPNSPPDINSAVCRPGNIEQIPNNSNLSNVAIITACNYLKQQNLKAENWLITTTISYKDFDHKRFPVIELSMTERTPQCTVCMDHLAAMIPADSQAQMSIQSCEAV